MSDFPQKKTVDCSRCQVCKVTSEDAQLYITPEAFRFQYAYCLEHYEERVGALPYGWQDDAGFDYEPYDLDA